MYYLAYGMNTNREAMAARCPKAKPLGGFYLPDHRLTFRGVADFRYDSDMVLPVAVVDRRRILSLQPALVTSQR